jgi:hypothetical protein
MSTQAQVMKLAFCADCGQGFTIPKNGDIATCSKGCHKAQAFYEDSEPNAKAYVTANVVLFGTDDDAVISAVMKSSPMTLYPIKVPCSTVEVLKRP